MSCHIWSDAGVTIITCQNTVYQRMPKLMPNGAKIARRTYKKKVKP